MSSIIVYGKDGKIAEEKFITLDTLPEPSVFYGKEQA